MAINPEKNRKCLNNFVARDYITELKLLSLYLSNSLNKLEYDSFTLLLLFRCLKYIRLLLFGQILNLSILFPYMFLVQFFFKRYSNIQTVCPRNLREVCMQVLVQVDSFHCFEIRTLHKYFSKILIASEVKYLLINFQFGVLMERHLVLKSLNFSVTEHVNKKYDTSSYWRQLLIFKIILIFKWN